MSPREIRKKAHCSLARAAVMSGVSEPTARLFEANVEAVKDLEKRDALVRFYAQLAKAA